MKKQLFALVLLGMILLSVSSVSALEWDNAKFYDSATKEVVVKNGCLLGVCLGGDIGKAKLNTPLDYVVPIGYQKVAEYEITSYVDYEQAMKNFKFYDLKRGGLSINRQIDLKFKSYEDIEVQDYVEDCKEIYDAKNGTISLSCNQKYIGSHIEKKETWIAMEKGDLNKDSTFTIGIFTDVKNGDKIEWIPNLFGVDINEWATWTASLNVGLKYYYTFDNAGESVSGIKNLTTGAGSPQFVQNSSSLQLGQNKSGYCPSGNAGWNLADEDFFDITGGEISINFWYWKQGGSGGNPIISKKWADTPGWYIVEQNTNGLTYNGIGTAIYNGIPISGAWTMATATTNNSHSCLYRNGTLINCVSTSYESATSEDLDICGSYDDTAWYDGYIDELGFWNRTLTPTEIIQLYNGGVGMTYINQFDTAPTIILNSPANSFNSSTSPTSINFNCSISDDFAIKNATLVIDGIINSTFFGDGVINETEIYISNQYTDGSYSWYCQAYDYANQTTTSATRTFNIDSTAPSLILNSNISNVTTLILPLNISLNYTASDSNLDSCWYYSTMNNTNTTFTCNTSQTIAFNSSGAHSIYYFANDTFGNLQGGTAPFYIYYVQPSATAISPITEGGLSSHSLWVNMTNINSFTTNAYLVWNGTNYGAGTKTAIGNDSARFDKTIIVPSINGTSVNWTWFYNISGNPNVTNWNVSGSQNYIALNISECGAGTYQILNYTMFDQKTKVIANASLNASIEVDLTLTSYENESMEWQFHTTKTNSNNLLICLPSGALNNSAYQLDSIAKYSFESHVVQYHYIVNFNLTNSSIPQTIKLYDLATAESTSFLINYQDENYLYVEDAIIDVWRRYIGDGVFISVEHGKTDAQGQTRLHLVTEDIIYKFLVWIDGELVYTSPEYLALCQATPCQINLRKTIDDDNGLSERDNILYSYSFNKTSRTATFDFTTKDGTETTINMTILSSNSYENETACSTILTTSGGQISCDIPTAFTNTSYQTIIYKDGEFFGQSIDSLAPDSMELFGYTGIILTAIAYLFLALMGISSGIATIIFGIIGLVFMGIIQVFESGSIFGLASAIIWLIVAGVIIIFKITKRRIQ